MLNLFVLKLMNWILLLYCSSWFGVQQVRVDLRETERPISTILICQDELWIQLDGMVVWDGLSYYMDWKTNWVRIWTVCVILSLSQKLKGGIQTEQLIKHGSSTCSFLFRFHSREKKMLCSETYMLWGRTLVSTVVSSARAQWREAIMNKCTSNCAKGLSCDGMTKWTLKMVGYLDHTKQPRAQSRFGNGSKRLVGYSNHYIQ